MELFRELNQQGTTIVQVTHSEVNAAYGSRIIEVRDGWMVKDTANPELGAEVSASEWPCMHQQLRGGHCARAVARCWRRGAAGPALCQQPARGPMPAAPADPQHG